MNQSAANGEDGRLPQHQALVTAELSSSVSLAAEIGLDCRDILVDDTETGIDEEPVGTRETVPDLPDFVAGALERGRWENIRWCVGCATGNEMDS